MDSGNDSGNNMDMGIDWSDYADWAQIGLDWYQGDQDRQHSLQMLLLQLQFQYQYALRNLGWKIEDAEKHGIHPLAALGVSTGSPAPIKTFDNPKQFSQLGQNLVSLAQRREAKKMNQVILDQERAKQKNYELQNKVLEKELSDTGIPGQPNGLGITEFDQVDYTGGQGHYFVPNEIPRSSSVGFQSGIPPMYQRVLDPDGNLMRLPSEKAKEAIEDQWYSEFKFAWNDIGRSAKEAAIHHFPGTKAAKKHRQMLRLERNTLPDPGNGYYWAWKKFGGWKRIQDNNRPRHFYADFAYNYKY